MYSHLRFLLILLTSLSVINTLWCIVMSPYLLGNSFTEEIEEVSFFLTCFSQVPNTFELLWQSTKCWALNYELIFSGRGKLPNKVEIKP